MKVLVFEYITGGGLAGEAMPGSLQAEGDLMLQALVADLLELPDIDITVLRDARLSEVAGWVENLIVEQPADFEPVWFEALRRTDACWVIAPETDAVLEQLCRQVEVAGVHLLNSAAKSVALTASKSRTTCLLAQNSIPVVDNYSVTDDNGRWMVKPDNAAGCEGIHFFPDRGSAKNWLSTQSSEQQWILQPWLPGEHLSLSLLCKRGDAIVLSVNRQLLSEIDGQLRLTGCVVNTEAAGNDFEQLAGEIASLIPGLWGYVGVDLLRTDSGPVVIEINPRLTTSYVGLREAMDINPAGMVMSLLEQPPPQPVPYSGKVVKVEILYAS